MASKFSSPFMKKSPLQGAYTSAAGQGKIHVPLRGAFQQLQNDIVSGAKEGDRLIMLNKVKKGDIDWEDYCARYPKECSKNRKKEDTSSDDYEYDDSKEDYTYGYTGPYAGINQFATNYTQAKAIDDFSNLNK